MRADSLDATQGPFVAALNVFYTAPEGVCASNRTLKLYGPRGSAGPSQLTGRVGCHAAKVGILDYLKWASMTFAPGPYQLHLGNRFSDRQIDPAMDFCSRTTLQV